MANASMQLAIGKKSIVGQVLVVVFIGSMGGGRWAVHLTGWLARHSDLTLDAIDLMLCHELGHHVYVGALRIG
ncbi:MAG: hypothetical protein R3B45_09530 [Bdellovibrionota bacterium]